MSMSEQQINKIKGKKKKRLKVNRFISFSTEVVHSNITREYIVSGYPAQ